MSTTTYSTGTVSVGAGSTAVTGVGTAWLTGGIRSGDRLVLAGLTARIASVNSNTSITLARGWPGSAQSGADYDIWLEDDGVRSLVAANALLQSLGAGTLTSLGALAGAANLMPYWTGAGVMNTTALTAAGRALLDDADAAAMRVTLDLVKTTSSTDTTAGRVMKVGDGALLGVSSLLSPDDFNSLGDVGRFIGQASSTSAVVNTPLAAGLSGFQSFASPSRGAQLLIRSQGAPSGNRAFFRGKDSAWAAWSELIHKNNLLGTVSQSGGVPTGAVIERGSNANGDYVRFADGTQICVSAVLTVANANTALGALFESPIGSWTYPAAFAAPPSVTLRGSTTRTFSSTSDPTNTACSYRVLSPVVLNGSQSLSGMAIGRWF